jgi:hypothetical protein
MFCIDVIKFTAWREIFTVRGETNLGLGELVQDKYQARNEAANTILLYNKMKLKYLKFKILQRIITKFPAIQ